MSEIRLISMVIPFFNEEEGVSSFTEALLRHFTDRTERHYEFVLVDDGSTDRTAALLQSVAQRDGRVRLLRLAMNAGHQCALVAGMDAASGAVVVTMDGDGQHPFATADEMIRRWEADPGLGVIQALRQGMQVGVLKNLTSRLFYATIRLLLPDIRVRQGASDFRLVSRETLDVVGQYRDRHRNLRLLFASLRVSQAYIEYQVESRRYGKTRYSIPKMVRLATDGIFAFSFLPLRLILLLAVSTGTACMAFFVYALLRKWQGETVPGWTSTVVCLTALFTALFVALSIIAEYVARIYEEVKSHPPYVLRDGK